MEIPEAVIPYTIAFGKTLYSQPHCGGLFVIFWQQKARHALKKGTTCFGCNSNLKFSHLAALLVLINFSSQVQ